MKILSLFLLFLSVSAFAQHLPNYSLNKVKIVDKDRVIVFEVKSSAEADTQLDRLYYWYSGNTIHSTQGGYSGKLLNGAYNEYFANKSLKEQGFFVDGLKSGLWKSWREDGTLNQTHTWKQGILNGEFVVYDESGHILNSGRYKRGELNGKLLTFKGKDSTKTTRYRDGVIVIDHKSSPSFWQKVKHFKFKHKSDSTLTSACAPQQTQPMSLKKP
jgi:antitoxin component YwqK of YwqJK toxin-antitoxin module